MGGEEQERAHAENVQEHPAKKREIRGQAGGDEDMGRNRRGGRTEEILQNKGGRTGQGRRERVWRR